jgi:hypothetical protein
VFGRKEIGGKLPTSGYFAHSTWPTRQRSFPAGADTNLYDTLRSVALCASAFEILRPAKRETYKRIYEDLGNITWNLTDCKKYTVFGDTTGTLHSLPVWLFGEINRLRNDTLNRPGIARGHFV